MKNLFFFSFILILSTNLFGQEICDNAIDDDGDGLIDLNDEDCDCEGFGEVIESLIPNPSFEDRTCCPSGLAQLYCAIDWTQASDATSEYYNHCDFDHFGSFTEAASPLPCEGEGFVGFHSNSAGYMEYIGTMLSEPLLAGVEYTLHLYTAWGLGLPTLEFSIYGTPTGGVDLPWPGYTCPVGVGGWELLTSEDITFTMDGSWHEVTLTFVPAVDMNAIAIGGPCTPDSDSFSYYYADCLTLIDSDSFSDVAETGTWCDGDLELEASTDTVGGAWQWYKDGIALLGETSAIIDVMPYGLGDYSAVYFIGDNCTRKDHTIVEGEAVSADFEFTTACVGEPLDFTNTSVLGEGTSPDWEWNFGDGDSSTDENPSHTYTTPGTFTVELIALNDVGCNDTIEIDVIVDPTPNANFEFVINGASSQDGLTGGCIESEIQFNDLSTIGAPGVIVDWDWDFGDGDDSDLENPTHTYDVAGTYTVTLTVTSTAGCTATITKEIIMTNGLSIDLLVNEPTCFGFSDGSVTVSVVGGGGDLIFVITDSEGNEVNESNSNTANTLNKGWYYFDISDGSSCDAIDSVFLDEPGELDIDITVTDPLCFGFNTGWARVDSVYNTTGDYDGVSYIWNPNPAGVGGEGADSTYNMKAGDYTLTINDDNGCSKVFDFEVEQPTEMVFSELGFEPAYCRLHEYQSGNGVVFGAATGGTPDYDYIWKEIATGATIINTTWGGRNPGDYELTVIDANGCILKGNVFLDSLNPIADFSVTSAQLNGDLKGTAPVEAVFTNLSENFANPNNPTADTTFFWNLDRPVADWQVSHDYFEIFDTTYTAQGQTYLVDVCLVALNKNGCTDTACKVLTIYEPIVFTQINIFTPNSDGINDLFSFDFRSASISEFSCIIVNRWGIIVHEMDDISDAWDGTDKSGSLCNDGTYFYTYKAKTDNGTDLSGQGNITIAH